MTERDAAALKARVLAAAQATPSLLRRQFRLRATALLTAGALLPVLCFLVLGGLEAGPRPRSLQLMTGLGACAISGASLWVAFGNGGRMAGRARVWLGLQAVLAPLLFLSWKLCSSSAYAGMSEPSAGRPGLRCLGLTLLFASWPLLALALVRRRSDPTHPRLLGAALGIAAGTYAATLVDLWCPVGYAPHVLLGHALPVAVLGLVGAWIGDRVLALR